MIKNVLTARFLLVKVFLLLLFFEGYSQNTISGIVVDQFDQAPIAFVNISIAGTRKGTTSDIDGKFTLDVPSGTAGIIFSHINYDRRSVSSIDFQETKTITLKEKITNLNELVFFADENPAYGIIRNVIANRKNNNPKKLNSYSYKSYNKEVIKLDINKIRIDYI